MAKIVVEVFPWLSETFGSVERFILSEKLKDGTRLEDLLVRLTVKSRIFRSIVYDPERKKPVRGIEVILNGLLVPLPSGLDTRLHDGDKVTIIPPYAGG